VAGCPPWPETEAELGSFELWLVGGGQGEEKRSVAGQRVESLLGSGGRWVWLLGRGGWLALSKERLVHLETQGQHRATSRYLSPRFSHRRSGPLSNLCFFTKQIEYISLIESEATLETHGNEKINQDKMIIMNLQIKF
jgi:hypothetical protein